MKSHFKTTVYALLFFLSYSTLSLGQEPTTKTISGIISYMDAPVPDVNIVIKGTTKGTKSNVKGSYEIEANVGDIINYSHVGFKSVSIVVEDVTTTLNVQLTTENNQLDTAIVTARKNVKEVTEMEQAMLIRIPTPNGTIIPEALPGQVVYLSNNDLRRVASQDLITLITFNYGHLFKSRGGLNEGQFVAPQIMVDGDNPSIAPQTIAFENIEHMYLSKGLVIILTKSSPIVQKMKREAMEKKHQNQNYYANDAAVIDEDGNIIKNNIDVQTGEPKTIKGVITSLDAPLRDVNILVKNTSTGTKTNRKGRYTIKAKVGDILEFSHVSYKTVSIVIEDITEELNIDMIENTNELNEVVITAKTRSGEVLEYTKKANEAFNSSRGSFNPETSGYAIGYVDGKNINTTYLSLKEALVGKISGYHINGQDGLAYLRGGNTSITQDYPVAWEVDGIFTTDEPLSIDLSQVKSVHALKSLAATNKYGTQGAGGVIVIETHYGNLGGRSTKIALETEKHTNKNFYSNDAIELGNDQASKSEILIQLERLNNKDLAFEAYQALDLKTVHFADQINIANYFRSTYNDLKLTGEVLFNLANIHASNPEILKAVAFNLQTFGIKKKAVDVYKMILKLRPNYAQSHRDLANALKDNDQFTQAWRLYMNYLLQGHDVSGEGIGDIIYNEMEYLYFNRQNQTNIRETFVPKSEDIVDFRNDVRLLFEWNTSEAEFDLEFVSPDKRSYVFEHSLAGDQELITKEKQTGFSSKEFIIETVGDGEWLVNLTYLGNKKSDPTYLKVTTYSHWGTSTQKEEIKVYRLDIEHQKFQLKKINKQILLATK